MDQWNQGECVASFLLHLMSHVQRVYSEAGAVIWIFLPERLALAHRSPFHCFSEGLFPINFFRWSEALRSPHSIFKALVMYLFPLCMLRSV